MTGEQRDGSSGGFPLGAAVTMAELGGELHPLLRRLRAGEPVSWLPALGGWLVTSRGMALRVLREWGSFTVHDPRFSTARVVGPSMLSLDGVEHGRHREPFADAFRMAGTAGRLEELVRARAARLVTGFAAAGQAELRRSLAGPLAVDVVAEVLGLGETEPAQILSWYDQIVGAVSALAGQPAQAAQTGHESAQTGSGGAQADGVASGHSGGGAQADGVASGHSGGDARAGGAEAFRMLSGNLHSVISGGREDSVLAAAAHAGSLGPDEVVSNAAVAMFGGIETTEGMICNAVLYLLSHPAQLSQVLGERPLVDGAVEESLRLEPAAAVVDRYATADVQLGGAAIRRGDLVTVSLAGAGRDPAFFTDPDRFDVRRGNAGQHLAFAHGPHFCLGAQLARLEARAAIAALLQLPGLRLDPARPHQVRGVVFRKPPALHVLWDA